MELKIAKLNESVITPRYATEGSACFDIHSQTSGLVEVGAPLNCKTGLSFEIPKDHVMLVFSRSGHGFKNDVRLSNCVGVIDSDYRGELGVKLSADQNTTGEGLRVEVGDRVAQAMVIKCEQVQFTITDKLTPTERGTGGFGSTGRGA